ncbi:DNA polymerase delta subunit 3 [Drosophila biarmipes]|uniref:DNA polymerase delta subunit 3 n=1 Tax=Drosophila biarmipes TaxID=125945 RepID=UPI0007E606C7|nr:DNA polymerase delta subunit 3 [Drosophila biarmipes]
MSLKQALDDCMIDFDRCVLVTDLLEEYKLSYKEVNDVLEAYIKSQEPATKFEKRFLVHGKKKPQGSAAGEDLYSVVLESKLKDWMAKVQDAESQLYSVKIAGGTKSPAATFKPMQHLEVKLAKIEQRPGVGKPVPTANGGPATNGVKSEPAKTQGIKSEASKPSVKVEPSKSSIKTETDADKLPVGKGKPSPESKKTSPKDQASKAKPAAAKKGSINSFLTAAGSKPKEVKATPSKTAGGTMANFLKKQPPGAQKSPTEKAEETKKAAPAAAKKEAAKKSPSPIKNANTSVQLFDEESAESSDEEEKLDKLRRNVIGSDNESDVEKPSTSKRRRISDSEDEEQPPKKAAEQEVIAVDEEMDTEPANETYLDEDGFVITQRKPVKAQPAKKKVSPKAAAPASKKRSPASAGKAGKDAPKTKQAGIMSFLTKK